MLIGQDGLSFAPASKATIDAVSQYFGAVNGPCPAELAGGCTSRGRAGPLRRENGAERGLPGPGGHDPRRGAGLTPARPPPQPSSPRCRNLVEQALEDGAAGLSTGLEYQPGRFADAAELAALCAPVAAAGAVYVSHLRGYEADAWRGMRELTEIVRRAGVAGHVSHYHGPAGMLTGLLDDARGQGLDVTFDSYPYLRGSTILGMLALPGDVQAGGPDATLRRLAQPATRQRLARDWFPAIGGVLDRITLAYIGAAEWSWAEGMALTRGGQLRPGCDPGELVCELLTASQLAAGCVFAQPPTNTEADLRALLRHEAQLAGSDGILLGRWPHPRGWGAFARLLGLAHPGAGRLDLGAGRGAPVRARGPPVRPGRPRPAPPGQPRRRGHREPGHGPRPGRLREPAAARPWHPPRAGQRPLRAPRRQADRRAPRAGPEARLTERGAQPGLGIGPGAGVVQAEQRGAGHRRHVHDARHRGRRRRPPGPR